MRPTPDNLRAAVIHEHRLRRHAVSTAGRVDDELERLAKDLQPRQQYARSKLAACDELLFGGAAGGGKTELLLRTHIAECLAHPGNRTIVFRRVFPSLRRSIIPRLKTMLRGRAEYNGADHIFRFENGSELELGHLQRVDTVEDYQGAEYGLISFEELVEFEESQYEALIARLRAPVAGVSPRVLSTTNPGGIGHRWVKRRFVAPRPDDHDHDEPPRPGKIWSPRPTASMPVPLRRCFVSATIEDNPALLDRDPNYVARLDSIRDRGRRQALRHGDWDALEQKPGALWTDGLIAGTRRWRERDDMSMITVAVDPAWSGKGDETGIIVVGSTHPETEPDGVSHAYALADYTILGTPSVWAPEAIRAHREWRADRITGEARTETGEDVSMVLAGAGFGGIFKTVNARRGKFLRAAPVAQLFHPAVDGTPPRVHINGELPLLEGELVDWEEGDPDSPNRLDAFVWGVTDLLGLGEPDPVDEAWSEIGAVGPTPFVRP